jgi:cysteinyl-tRNA synthetase
MSKSLKNFIKIKEALKEHSPRQLRIMFLLQPWDKSMNYSDQVVSDAREKERVFRSFFGTVQDLVRSEAWLEKQIGWANPAADRALYLELAKAQDSVHAAFCNNFDTKSAMDALIALVVATNACVDRRVRRARGDLLSAPTAARSRCTRQARHCFFLTPPLPPPHERHCQLLARQLGDPRGVPRPERGALRYAHSARRRRCDRKR